MRSAFFTLLIGFMMLGAALAQGEQTVKTPDTVMTPVAAPKTIGKIINKDVIVEQLSTTGQGPDAGSIAFSSNAILFGYGSAVLREASHAQLMEIAKALNDPALAAIPFFFVDGHTCTIGTEERNCRLSWARAESVVKFLTGKGGVPAGRLKARGFGQKVPVVSNDTEENRQKNRRVVLKSGLLSSERDEGLQCSKNRVNTVAPASLPVTRAGLLWVANHKTSRFFS